MTMRFPSSSAPYTDCCSAAQNLLCHVSTSSPCKLNVAIAMQSLLLYVYIVTLWLAWFSTQLIVTLIEQWHKAKVQQTSMSRVYCAMVIAVFACGLVAGPVAIIIVATNGTICPVTAVVSFLVVILLISGGIVIGSRDRVFLRSKQSLFHLLLSELHHQPMSVARSRQAILRFALRTKCESILIGGIIASISVAVMVIGCKSSIFHLRSLTLHPGYALVAFPLTVVSTIITYLLLFRVLIMFPQSDILRQSCIAFITLETCLITYLLNAAIMVQRSSTIDSPFEIVVAIATATSIILSVIQHVVAQCSRHDWQRDIKSLSSSQSEEDSVVEQLSKRLYTLPEVKTHTRLRVRQVTPQFTIQPLHRPAIYSSASKTGDADDEV